MNESESGQIDANDPNDAEGGAAERVSPSSSGAIGSSVEEVELEVTKGREILGFVVGGITALLCAIAWIAVVVASGYEIGILAWLMGIVIGFAIKVARGAPSMPAGIMAGVYALLSLLGIKGLMFLLLEGEDASELIGLYDLLWTGLAVVSAFRIASGYQKSDD